MNNLPAKIDAPEMELSVEDVKKYIAPNATDKELFLFINIAKSYGLNPFKREIHFTKYGSSPGQTIVGYEMYLKRAEATGLLDGWTVVFDKDGVGEKAVITIHRKDRKFPFVWEVYRREFDKQQSTWKAMPYFMLKKVAISQGFRLAFPEQLGGMPYIPEEINVGQSEKLPPQSDQFEPEFTDAEFEPDPEPAGPPISTDKQRKAIYAIATKRGLNADQLKMIVKHRYGIDSSKDLTAAEASSLIGLFTDAPDDEIKLELSEAEAGQQQGA